MSKSRLAMSLLVVFVAAALVTSALPGEGVAGLLEGANALLSADQSRIEEWVARLGAWGPIMIVIMMVVQMFLLVVPSWLLMLVAMVLYGPLWGSAVAIMAIVAASTVGYLIGAWAGHPLLQRMIGEASLGKVCRETDRYGLWAVLVARLNPLLSNDAISFVGGLVNLGLTRFLLATLVGIAPLTLAMAVMGQDWQAMKWGLLALSLVSLIGLALKIWIDRRSGVTE